MDTHTADRDTAIKNEFLALLKYNVPHMPHDAAKRFYYSITSDKNLAEATRMNMKESTNETVADPALQHCKPALTTEFPSDEELSLMTDFPSDEELADGLKTYAHQLSIRRTWEFNGKCCWEIVNVLTQYGLFSQENMDAAFIASLREPWSLGCPQELIDRYAGRMNEPHL